MRSSQYIRAQSIFDALLISSIIFIITRYLSILPTWKLTISWTESAGTSYKEDVNLLLFP